MRTSRLFYWCELYPSIFIRLEIKTDFFKICIYYSFKKTINSLYVSSNNRYFMKNNYNFQKVSLFDILFCKSLQFSSVGYRRFSSISSFNLLWHHTSLGLWKTPLYTYKRMIVKKVNNVLKLLWKLVQPYVLSERVSEVL